MDSDDKLLSEIKLLKRIIQEQEEKYMNLEKVNKLLEDNNELLQEKVKHLNTKFDSITISNKIAISNEEISNNMVENRYLLQGNIL